MSEFAFFRFKSNNMLTVEEEQQKDDIIKITAANIESIGISKEEDSTENAKTEEKEEEKYELSYIG
jgi:hypothetical protein